MKIGYAFSDHIKTEKIRRRQYKEPGFRPRSVVLVFIGLFLCAVLIVKLISIQVVNGEYYRSLSDSNRIRTSIIHAPRGIILDRKGTPLVYNLPGFRRIEHTASDSGSPKTVLLSHDEAIERIARGERGIEIDSLRQYPYKEATSHILGYVGQISAEQIKQERFKEYNSTDLLGKDGIEEQYESILRGENGKQLIEVDAMGNPVRTLGQTEPISGKDIRLTIDIHLQEKTYDAMKSVLKGAAIVSTPKGEILSLISKPSYDPNLFTLDSSYKTASDSGYTDISEIILDSENQPLLNRAISGVYPPASTFKIITSAAGLEEGLIDEDFTVTDNGVITIGPYSFSNWYYTQYGRKEGPINVVRSLARSNDIFFYKLAEMLTVDKLSKHAKQFGVGETLGIDLSGEAKGILPTQEWKKRQIGEQWYLGDTFIYGIGQGYLLATPLQVNSWTEIVANGGTLYQPHLLYTGKDEIIRKDFLKDETVRLLQQGMIEACSQGGTAYPLFNVVVENKHLPIDNENYFEVEASSVSAKMNLKEARRVQVACKTGTAEHGGEKTPPHSWITVYAPSENPEVVVTVLVESGGEGSAVAAPIAKKILEAYFSEKR